MRVAFTTRAGEEAHVQIDVPKPEYLEEDGCLRIRLTCKEADALSKEIKRQLNKGGRKEFWNK